MPVVTRTSPTFNSIGPLTYQALLYELRDQGTNNTSNVAPNWFGVAIPAPDTFDLSSGVPVYVILYFHPTPGQAGYNSLLDYMNKDGKNGTDWKQLYGYVDRLGGQMAGALQSGPPMPPNNRLVIFPFLTDPPTTITSHPDPNQHAYTLHTSEWFNVIHDILQDINTNVVPGICNQTKKLILATISNGSVYLNYFLAEALAAGLANNIIEVWDFDSDIASWPTLNVPALVDPPPSGIGYRAYWQNSPLPASSIGINLPPKVKGQNTWRGYDLPAPDEVPPLPPHADNSTQLDDPTNPNNSQTPPTFYHHIIRDTMFLDAVWNIENDNP